MYGKNVSRQTWSYSVCTSRSHHEKPGSNPDLVIRNKDDFMMVKSNKMIFFKGITYPRITFSIHYIPERSLFLFSMLCSSIRYYILLTLSYISIKRFSSCDFSFAYSLFIYTLLYLFKFHGHFPQFLDRPNKDLTRIPNKFMHVLLPQGINCRLIHQIH